MPLRDDFEKVLTIDLEMGSKIIISHCFPYKEYDNDSEKIISSLDIAYDDEDIEKGLVSLLSVYK